MTVDFFFLDTPRGQSIYCKNDWLCFIFYLCSLHDDFNGCGTISMSPKSEFSPYFKGDLRCQLLPQESEALYRGSRCSAALLFLLCFNSDHRRASSWDRKCSVYTQTLAFFLRVPIITVFFCETGTHPLWLGLHPPTHFAQAMEHASDGNDSCSCANLRKSRSLPAEWWVPQNCSVVQLYEVC